MIIDGDGPLTEYATRATYPADHTSMWAGETLLMSAGDDGALAQRRRDIHRDHGAEAELVCRTWTSGEWGPV